MSCENPQSDNKTQHKYKSGKTAAACYFRSRWIPKLTNTNQLKEIGTSDDYSNKLTKYNRIETLIIEIRFIKWQATSIDKFLSFAIKYSTTWAVNSYILWILDLHANKETDLRIYETF